MKDELIKKLRELIGWCKTTNQLEVASILLTLVGSLYGNSTRELMKIVAEHSAKQIQRMAGINVNEIFFTDLTTSSFN